MSPDELQRQIDELRGEVNRLSSEVEIVKDTSGNPNLSVGLAADSRKTIEEIIQERVFGVVWDQLYTYNTDFQSLDNFSTSTTGDNSGVQFFGGGVQLGANDTGGGAATASINRVIANSSRFNFDEESRFRTEIGAGNGDDNFDADFEVGAEGNNTAYGFKISDAVIKGFTTDASATNEVDLGTTFDTSSAIMSFEAQFFPGERVDFYINNEIKGSSSSNLPQTSTTILWNADISTTAYSGNNRNIIIYFWDYFQRKIN